MHISNSDFSCKKFHSIRKESRQHSLEILNLPFVPPEALRRSNQALRLRCEEMEGWQQRTRDEREFLSCRFQEARALVERLAQENHSLRVTASGPGSSPSSGVCCSSSQTEDQQGRPTVNGPTDGAQVVYRSRKEWIYSSCRFLFTEKT